MGKRANTATAKLHIAIRANANASSALSACAIGLFLAWFDIAFRTNAHWENTAYAPPFRFDIGWIAVLSAAAFCLLTIALIAHKSHSVAASFKASAALGACGSCAMFAGLVLFSTVGQTGSQLTLISGIVAGIGAALLVVAWLPGASASNPIKDVLIVLCATVVSMVAMAAMLAVPAQLGLALLSALPLASGFCTLAAIRWEKQRSQINAKHKEHQAGAAAHEELTTHVSKQRPLKTNGSSNFSDPSTDASRQTTSRCIVILVSSFIVFFLLGIIGAPASATPQFNTYWLYEVAGTVEVALLCAILFCAGPSRLSIALLTLLATSIACTPFFYLVDLNPICVTFLKLTTLCTYALAMLFFADCWRTYKENARRALSFCCALLAAIALLMVAGLIAGGALNQMEAFDATTFTLVAIILLYFVLVAALFLLAKHRRILHVISGSFDSEKDLAEARLDALCALHPSLSARERDVLLLLLQHYSTPRIAETLVVSENTVKTHIRHIYAKLNINSKQELLAYAKEAAPLE